MRKFISRFRPLLFLLLLFFSHGLLASGLDADKNKGLLGETSSGYIGFVVADVDASTRTRVKEINQKRRAEYQRIAKANGLSVKDVEKLAAKKAFQKTAPGNYIKPAGSGWVRK